MEAQEEEWQPITYSLIALKLWNSNGVSDFYGLQALGSVDKKYEEGEKKW